MTDKIVGWMFLFALTLVGCQSSANDRQDPALIVAAAANVQFAMAELETTFEQQTGIQIDVVLGSSGKLMAQIQHGAPFDLFVSADLHYPTTLFNDGFATAPPKIYAYGTLVWWTTQPTFDLQQLRSLHTDFPFRKLAIPNPKNAPYGVQAIAVLKHYDWYEQLQSRLVLGESIAQTNQYILSGACELGITAKSVVTAPAVAQEGRWVEVDTAAYQPIAQGVVITTYGQHHHPSHSQAFYDFLFSETGKRILTKYGYR